MTEYFGRTLRRFRLAAGLGQEDLAELAGLSARGIRALETGERTPRLETVRMLADALALTGAARGELVAAARPELAHAAPSAAIPPDWLPVSSRLPIAPTRLVGRESDVAQVCALLRDLGVRLLTLTGPGGVGKTRTAIAAVRELTIDFPDGAIFIDLAPIHEPNQVAPAVARALGIPETGKQALAEALCALVASRAILIVLDNCEQVLSGMPLVARLLAASPGLKVLATSRERLHLRGERELSVAPLALPGMPAASSPPGFLAGMANVPAVRLFVERAEEASPGFTLSAANAEAVAQICHRLEGLPLAIELAATHADRLSPAALLARLDRRLPLLTGGPRDLPARQQTMRGTIAWSYDLLSPDEQALFRRLAVFTGGFSQDAAVAVGAPITADLIDTLVQKSLLQRRCGPDDSMRFMVLEMVREFAAEQLATSGEESAARDRHAAWMLRLMEEASPAITPTQRTPDAARWLTRVQAEQDNLHGALTWLETSEQWPELLRLAAAAGPYWELHLNVWEGRRWLERALDPARSINAPLALRARALRGLGRLTLDLGDLDAAEATLEHARAAYAELGDEAGAAIALRLLGAVAEYRGDDDLCLARDTAALNLFRAIGDSVGMAGSLDDLADLAFRRGDFDEAARLAEASVAAARAGGSPIRLVGSLAVRGEAASARGESGIAAEALRESLSLAWALGFDFGILDAVAVLADVAQRTGRATQAARLLGAARTYADGRGLATLPHHALFRATRAAASQDLGADAFAAAWATGQTLPIEQAVMEALDLVASLVDMPHATGPD